MFMAVLSFPQCQVTGCFLHLMTIWLWDLTRTAQSAYMWLTTEWIPCQGQGNDLYDVFGIQDRLALDISVWQFSLG